MTAARTVQDRLGETRAHWKTVIARFDANRSIRALPETFRVFYHAAALLALGILESYRDDSSTLAIAERLEGFGMKLYEMSADQLRMLYHGLRGEFALSERYRERVELHAIQRGTA